MAERATGKAKRAGQTVAHGAPGRGRAHADQGGDDAGPLSADQERDGLKVELEAARARIAELERERADLLNRIDWIIDSLHSLLEDGR